MKADMERKWHIIRDIKQKLKINPKLFNFELATLKKFVVGGEKVKKKCITFSEKIFVRKTTRWCLDHHVRIGLDLNPNSNPMKNGPDRRIIKFGYKSYFMFR